MVLSLVVDLPKPDQLTSEERLQVAHSVAVVTGTFYKDWYPGEWIPGKNDTAKVRGDLALQTMKAALDAGYQLVAVDGGSSDQFKAAAEGLGIKLQVQTETTMSGSRREGFISASILDGVKAIAWLEPEKLSLITDEKCLFDASQLILNDQADVVVLERDQAGLASIPDYQAKSEEEADKKWSSILRIAGILLPDQKDLKPFFGPKIFKNTPELLKIFTTKYELNVGEGFIHSYVKPDSYSDATFYPIAEALWQHLRVVPKEVPYLHPEMQTKIEADSEKGKTRRKDQKYDIVLGLVEFIKLKQGKPSRLKIID